MKLLLLAFLVFPVFSSAKNFVPSSFSAQYEESLTSATGKQKKSFGKLDYKYPSHLRFEVTEPVPSLIVVNPDQTWIYQPAFVEGEMGQVTIQKSANSPLVKFLDSIKDGVKNSKHFSANYNKKELILDFTKKAQKDLGIEQVVLHAPTEAQKINELKGFESITLKYSNKNKTSIKLLDLKENVTFTAEHFRFSPPKNTRIINN